MKIDDLVLFVEVAEQLSFTGAANTYDLPQSTVSRKIKHIEDALGVRLFERTCRDIFLTEPGKYFYQHCKKIVTEFGEAKAFIGDYASTLEGEVTIYCLPSFAKFLARDFLSVFIKKFPHINIVAKSFEPDFIEQTQEGDLIFYLIPAKDPNIEVRRLFTVYRRFYASPDYLREHGIPLHPSDLARHTCLRFDTRIEPVDQWSYVENEEVRSVKVHGGVTSDSIDITCDLALKDLGVCWIPQTMADKHVREGRLVCLFDGKYALEQPYYVMYRSRNHMPQRVKVFLDMLTQYIDQHYNSFN